MAMDQRSTFLIELLDKLGVPLMEAVQAHARPDTPPAQEAGTLAALLGQSVQLGLSVAQKLDLKEGQGDADAVRLALAAMSAKLVGESYRLQGRVPAENDTARMTRALEAVLTFADNFTPSAEHTARLRTASAEKPLFDMAQSQVFYLSAMEPVLGAIAEFPFGQNETTMIQSAAEKLQQRASMLREAMIGASAEKAESSFAELMILQALARIYADCHRGETARIVAANNNDAAPSIDVVWKAFDLRLAMLETLLNVAVPDDAPERTAPAVPTAAPIAAPAEPPAVQQNDAPSVTISPPPDVAVAPMPMPAPDAAAPAAPVAPGGGPMSFFGNKPPVQAIPGVAQPEAPPAEPPKIDPANPMSFFGAIKKDDQSGQA